MNTGGKKKRIAIVDADRKLVEAVLRFVDQDYDFEFTDAADAPYVFHSIGGYDVLKYPGVRIFLSGENVSPNFGISDYAMTFDRMTFGDRYQWLPLMRLYHETYQSLLTPRPEAKEALAQKNDFCAYVMSNTSNSASERTEIFDRLCGYKKVNSGGAWRNNVGGRVPDKLAFQSRHKFVIAFENYSYPGYLTEKFSDAAAANAVPIYWGDPDVAALFNPKAFVNCHAFENLEAVVAEVAAIDQDDVRYLDMLSQPWFPNGEEPNVLRAETIAGFLRNVFDQDPQSAYRRNLGRWGVKRERQMIDAYHRPHVQAFRLLRAGWRTVYHKIVPRRKKY